MTDDQGRHAVHRYYSYTARDGLGAIVALGKQLGDSWVAWDRHDEEIQREADSEEELIEILETWPVSYH